MIPKDAKKSLPRKGNPGLLARTITRKSGCKRMMSDSFIDPLLTPAGRMRLPSASSISPFSIKVYINIDNID